MFSNADLAEVMQHSGKAKFFDLIHVETNAGIEAGIGLGNSVRQSTGEGGQPLAVPAGGGIPAFNGLHAGGNEPFEQEVNLLRRDGIFDGDADLVAERDEILEIVLAEQIPILVIDGLEHTQKAAMSRDWHTDHIARDKSAALIRVAEETGIVLDIVDDNRLSSSSDISRNTLSASETSLPYGRAPLAMAHQYNSPVASSNKSSEPSFGIHQRSGRFDSALADGRVIETRIQQGADILKLSQCGVFHNMVSRMPRCAECFRETVTR